MAYEIYHSVDFPHYEFAPGWYYWLSESDRKAGKDPAGPFRTYRDAERAVKDTLEQAEAQRSQNK